MEIQAPSLSAAATSEAAPPRIDANLPVSASIAGPGTVSPWKGDLSTETATVGPILLYENFSRFREGDPTSWGANTFIKTGLDHRNWLVSNLEGTHPVGCRIRLPHAFSFQCRYSVYLPEITRGVLGWWKEPVSTKIAFLNDQGIQYAIQWVIGYGNDATRPNPLGSPSLYAKRYYHTLRLPDGIADEVGVVQPTGVLRIERDNNVIRVLMDGQSVVAGTMDQIGQLVGFEIDLINARNGSLFFTDFKITH